MLVLMASELVSAIILAVIQGITEWIPVSSSGHLVLFEKILGYKGGLVFDVALHFGTLMAVFVYFGKDIIDIIEDLLKGNWKSENGRLGLMLVIASVPAALLGFFTRGYFDAILSNLAVVAWGFALTGVFLLIASVPGKIKVDKIGWREAFFIGSAQALSIIPGISRSGATMSSGVLVGLSEKNAMKFAFLLSIPVVFGANIVSIGNNTLPPELIWATLVGFGVGLASIHVIFNYILISRKNFAWFGIYCILLSIGLGIYLAFA
ncbi:undecaprenyl-diphosphatase [Candidatus Pacearchaeota archaeon CG_4_9_14_0_2_um_filter_39_13]|nr:MAG: undecaprenyl-diphosphatase [Candidatus Pacearchaeota archaeon CG_4_9_14_0_2_um_filter_39_13]